MARTTSSAVQLVLMNDYDGTSSLTTAIDSASSLVDDIVECAAEDDVTLSTAKLELIERWLAAYFYALSDKPFTQKQTADASASFQVTKEHANNYLEGALRLDPTGCLSVLGSEVRIRGYWLGKAPSAQIDYRDRD